MRVTLVEQGATLGGNHVWSFFDSDIADEDRWIVAPFVSHRWDGYDVCFPGHRRALSTAYNSIDSERFDRVLREQLRESARLGEAAEPEILPSAVGLVWRALVLWLIVILLITLANLAP